MRELRILSRSAALAAVVAFAAACGGGDKADPNAQKPAPAKMAKAAAPAPTAAAYHYDPTDKVDPFKSYIKRQITLDTEGESSPLERFDLSQLVVMGIIWGVDEPRALIKDPTGKGYIVRAGTPIGKNKGRILRIEDNKVVVKETYLDHLDRATTKEVELELYANGRRNGA
ncbi:MAG TPA: pilus assembly protein PilP [Myxococcota bacterium]|nr:pilus assembly protein PilP [Myxococcota bacterium]